MMKFWFIFFTITVLFSVSCMSGEQVKTEVKSEFYTKSDSLAVKVMPMPNNKNIDEVMGKFDPAHHQDFVIIDKKYCDRNDRLMHIEAYQAFIEMWNAAKEDGIHLIIKSATRNFNYQKGIWERKWNGVTKVSGNDLSKTIIDPVERALKILEYSSMPGTSRHHWGTDIDLNAFENTYFATGEGLKVYNWLKKNGPTYGFCQPYTEKGSDRPYGYNEEKWHWSYLPVANLYMNQIDNINDEMIRGFDGSETAEQIKVVEKYMSGIHSSCK